MWQGPVDTYFLTGLPARPGAQLGEHVLSPASTAVTASSRQQMAKTDFITYNCLLICGQVGRLFVRLLVLSQMQP
jgi:hypothetical protein